MEGKDLLKNGAIDRAKIVELMSERGINETNVKSYTDLINGEVYTGLDDQCIKICLLSHVWLHYNYIDVTEYHLMNYENILVLRNRYYEIDKYPNLRNRDLANIYSDYLNRWNLR